VYDCGVVVISPDAFLSFVCVLLLLFTNIILFRTKST
jgi:hypothetical protein